MAHGDPGRRIDSHRGLDGAFGIRACRANGTFIGRWPFSKLIERSILEQIDLKNGLTIEIQTASFRTVRGYTIVAALCDEAAFWRGDETSSTPDVEIVNALRPAMATVPGSMLLIASSPHAKQGVLWDMHSRHYSNAHPLALKIPLHFRLPGEDAWDFSQKKSPKQNTALGLLSRFSA